MRPFIKRKRFSRPSSVRDRSVASSNNAAFTAAFLDRPSIFETLRAYKGTIFLLEEHLTRFSDSCAALEYRSPLVRGDLARWLKDSLRESGWTEAMLRVSAHWNALGEAELLLFVRPFSEKPPAWYEKGVSLRTAVGRRPSPRAQSAQIKASQYVSGVLATLDKGDLPAHELLFFGPDGTVAEGTVSNVFILKQKCLLTPSVGSGILKGVTRAFVMALARKSALAVRETPLTRHDLYTAEECFITNTSSEVLPVVRIDGRRIGDGRPGKWTRRLKEDFIKNR